MKKAIVGILLLCLLLCFQTVFADGTCGTNVKYTISGNTLTYAKEDPAEDAEWADDCRNAYNNDITVVKIADPIHVSDAYRMFADFTYVETMDLAKLDVSDVTNMSEMFRSCHSLVELNVSGWDTSNVTNMFGMFDSCNSLVELNVSGWDTSNVTNMSLMFWETSLTSLDLSGWDTSHVTNMSFMFMDCYFLESLDLRGWNTSSVTSMSYMFSFTSLSNLDVSGWDTSNVTNMSYMFSSTSLTSLDVSRWDTSNVIDMSGMFRDCYPIANLDVSGWDTSNVTDMNYMFWNTSLSNLDVSGWDTSKVVNMSNMFSYCRSLTNLDVSSWNTSNVTDMRYMFTECSNLTYLDVSGWNTSNVTDMRYMFTECSILTNLDVSGWDTSKVTDMRNMFWGCYAIENLDVSGWNTSRVTNMYGLFRGCFLLTEIDVSRWNVSRVTDMSRMFQNCKSLKILDMTGWNTSRVKYVRYMFRGCYKLTGIDMSNWNSSEIIDFTGVFDACRSLNALVLGQHTLEKNFFASLQNYDLPWYYIVQGKAAGNPLKLKTEKNNASLFTDYDYNTMSGIWSAEETPAIAIALTITDSAGTNITGKTVISSTLNYQLRTNASPSNAGKKINWKSSDTAVASVTSAGKVIFNKAGIVTITAESADLGKKTAMVKLKLLPEAAFITIKNSAGTVITGKTITLSTLSYQLKASAAPTNADQGVTWKSSDTAVAAVDRTGKVTFKKDGTVTITATSTDRGKTAASVKLKLLPKATSIVIKNSSGTVITGKTITSKELNYQLTASAAPADASQTVTWKSSDTAVAVIDRTGRVTFKKDGTVTITATSTDWGKKTGMVKLTLLPKATKIIIRNPEGNKVNGKTVKISTKAYKLTASATPAKAEQTVTWKSSNISIATVNKNGKVIFKKAGTVKIYATSTDRGKKLGVVKLKYVP